ncbi:Phage tail assembly protein [Cronobacter condimenti 1330]|uniref:Phage tail assembly protein n=1 Tax=Cronobacter condimenti 1330 TaxID=1073999 RepID=K8A2I0_9ENTR|nr:NlpC/P60 family protein [Cronobacter condimenti]CCJ73480.1 Phage tail assembly protein [Cronobacter condimenti 1330]
MRDIPAALIIESVGAFIELSEANLQSYGGDVIRFHSGTNGYYGDVVWKGGTCPSYPIAVERFQSNNEGAYGMDCYTLFRDAYHLCGIDLPDFKRTQGGLREENLYLKNMEANGFHRVELSEARPGDVIIRQPFPGADSCHAMILLHENMVLHHDCAGHLSRREPYRPAFIKQTHSIWRHERCSSLNLQGIYEDISERSR